MTDRLDHECEERETLEHLLKWLKNQVINVITQGGWLFTGKLVVVEDEQAVLRDVTVTASGGLTLSSFEVDRVAIFLDDITSAGKPAALLIS